MRHTTVPRPIQSIPLFDVRPMAHQPFFYRLGAVVLAGISLVCVGGCQQTPGSVLGGPLVPFSSTNPNSNSPALSPFGAATRVSPPATGAAFVPNNHMGGASSLSGLPANSGYLSGDPASSYPNSAPSGFESGSNLQQVGWQSPNVPIRAVPSSQFPPASKIYTPAVPREWPERTGQLRAIDLTSAPAPPGYIPRNNTPPNYNTQPTSSIYQSTSQAMGPPSLQPTVSPSLQPITQQQMGHLQPVTSSQMARSEVQSSEGLQWRRPGSYE